MLLPLNHLLTTQRASFRTVHKRVIQRYESWAELNYGFSRLGGAESLEVKGILKVLSSSYSVPTLIWSAEDIIYGLGSSLDLS